MSGNLSFQESRKQKIQVQIQEVLRELPPLCHDYIRSIMSTTTPLTRLGYVHDLRTFFFYLCLERPQFGHLRPSGFTASDLAMITLRDLEMYQEYLRQYVKPDYGSDALFDEKADLPEFTSNQDVSIARKLSAVRSFYKYLYTHEYIRENVTEKVRMPKIREKPIIYLDRDEVGKMLDAVYSGNGLSERQKKYQENTRIRDMAIICLLIGTGIRASELIGLDIEDMDLESKGFVVTRKGGNQVILYFNDQVRDALEPYIRLRKTIEALPGHENALFLSIQKKRISARALQDLVKKYASCAAPLKKRLSPHKLRSTYGTNLYRETGDIYLVAVSLGHSNVNTTRSHYAATDEDQKRAAAGSVNWVDPQRES